MRTSVDFFFSQLMLELKIALWHLQSLWSQFIFFEYNCSIMPLHSLESITSWFWLATFVQLTMEDNMVTMGRLLGSDSMWGLLQELLSQNWHHSAIIAIHFILLSTRDYPLPSSYPYPFRSAGIIFVYVPLFSTPCWNWVVIENFFGSACQKFGKCYT